MCLLLPDGDGSVLGGCGEEGAVLGVGPGETRDSGSTCLEDFGRREPLVVGLLIPDANGVIGRACREPAAIEIILCIQNVVVVARVHDFLELYGWVQTRGRGEACRAG